jgi:hypothetical protein
MAMSIIITIHCPKYLAVPTQIPNYSADVGLSVVPADRKNLQIVGCYWIKIV